jgi:replicative DNA helicase
MQQRLDAPVVLLAQLGIKHQKDNPVPAAWHIRDCSQAIQDCDRAYVIDRPEAEPERWKAAQKSDAVRAKALEGKAVIKLEKNRNGIGGKWESIVPFDKECGRFGQPRLPNPHLEF